MLGIDPKLLCHLLTVDLQVKSIFKIKKKFGEEKRRVVKEETSNLLVIAHIQ